MNTAGKSPDHLSIHRSQSPAHNAPFLVTERERFPSIDENRATGSLYPVASPQDISPAQIAPDRYKWPARKSNQRPWEVSRNTGLPAHRTRRSVSEALGNLRDRRGSYSENAQELAEALKAPVSYQLIVCRTSISACLSKGLRSNQITGALHCLVYDLSADEHIFKIDSNGLAQTCDTHYNPICLCFDLVPSPRLCRVNISKAQEVYSRFEEWNNAAIDDGHIHRYATSCFPAFGPSPELLRNLQNTRLAGPHYQRPVSTVYSACL